MAAMTSSITCPMTSSMTCLVVMVVVSMMVCLTHGTTTVTTCTSDWTLETTSNLCYKLSTDTQNYTSAITACQAVTTGSDIAAPTTEQINDIMATLRLATSIWVPITDTVSDGTWLWYTGTAVSFHKWSLDWGEPQLGNEHDCGRMYLNDGLWYAWNCSDVMYYICTRPTYTTTVTTTAATASADSSKAGNPVRASTTTVTTITLASTAVILRLGLTFFDLKIQD